MALRALPDGREIPCFGLTSPAAAQMARVVIDSGIICKGTFEGKKCSACGSPGHKRYITLGSGGDAAWAGVQCYDPAL